MAKVTDPVPVTMDTSYLTKALNDLRSQGRSLALLSPFIVPTVPLVGSEPYLQPHVHTLTGAAAGTEVTEAVNACADGYLSLVTCVSGYHDDAVAHHMTFYVRCIDPALTVDVPFAFFNNIATNILGISAYPKHLILNSNQKIVVGFSSMGAGKFGYAKWISYEFPVGLVPEPCL